MPNTPVLIFTFFGIFQNFILEFLGKDFKT